MIPYVSPHIDAYTDAEIHSLTEINLAGCHPEYFVCTGGYTDCNYGFSMKGGKCPEKNYCAESHTVCKVYSA